MRFESGLPETMLEGLKPWKCGVVSKKLKNYEQKFCFKECCKWNRVES